MARVRHVPGTEDRLLASPWVITRAEPTVDFWQNRFPSAQPLLLEIGSGRGRFLYEAAARIPDHNFIGLDIVPEIIMEAIDEYSLRDDWPQNIRFISVDAQDLWRIFPPQCIERIYLHFSDPWPKNRHAKRRLTAPHFLDIYRKLLKKDGDILFKTDHADFYNWTFDTLKEEGWQILDAVDDLYKNLPADNIATEYEGRYHKKGVPIGRIVARPPQE